MDFSLDEDHIALRDAVQRFCDGEYPAEQRGAPETPEQAARRWQAMAEMGLLGLPFSANVGGSGLGPVAMMLVAQELGRALGGGDWLSSTVMAGCLIRQLGSDAQQAQWLPALASGERRAAVAIDESAARYDWCKIAVRAERHEAAWTLHGHKTLVLHGDNADLLVVVARSAGRPGLREGLSTFVVQTGAAGVQVQGFSTLDGRRAAHIEFNNAPAQLLGEADHAADAVELMLDMTNAALCAEAAGAIEALLSHTAEHLRTRKQFGVPLAKFQVLQHRVADMAIGLEQMKSMACAAAAAVESGDLALTRRVVSAAKVYAAQQGRKLSMDAIQMHGGMGMTDECRVGHYAKRLMVIGQLFGDAGYHLKRITGH